MRVGNVYVFTYVYIYKYIYIYTHIHVCTIPLEIAFASSPCFDSPRRLDDAHLFEERPQLVLRACPGFGLLGLRLDLQIPMNTIEAFPKRECALVGLYVPICLPKKFSLYIPVPIVYLIYIYIYLYICL